MTQEPDEETKAQQREVQRMLGRCMLRLQQYERQIKAIMAAHEISAPIQELQDAQSKRAESVARKTLGTLVGELVGSFLIAGEPDTMPDLQDDTSGHRATVSIRFTLGLSAEDYAQTEAELRELVQLRNSLVHHFIDQHDLWSVEGCKRAQEALDADFRRIDTHYHRLRTWAEDIQRAGQQVEEYVQSDEFRDKVFSDTVLDSPESRPVPIEVERSVHAARSTPQPRDRNGRRGSARTR